MKKVFRALSIVAPNGQKIADNIKTLEIRSWLPTELPLKDLVIVENKNYLKAGEQELGYAIALVDIVEVKSWLKDDVEAACASYWKEGYYAWKIANVRPFDQVIKTDAKRKIYLIEIDHA